MGVAKSVTGIRREPAFLVVLAPACSRYTGIPENDRGDNQIEPRSPCSADPRVGDHVPATRRGKRRRAEPGSCAASSLFKPRCNAPPELRALNPFQRDSDFGETLSSACLRTFNQTARLHERRGCTFLRWLSRGKGGFPRHGKNYLSTDMIATSAEMIVLSLAETPRSPAGQPAYSLPDSFSGFPNRIRDVVLPPADTRGQSTTPRPAPGPGFRPAPASAYLAAPCGPSD